jgi:hypothetical protein
MANQPPDDKDVSWMRETIQKITGKTELDKAADFAKSPEAKAVTQTPYEPSAFTATPMTKKPESGGGNAKQIELPDQTKSKSR